MNKMINVELTNSLRANALYSIYLAKSGHPGGVLSAIDIIAFLFLNELDFDPKDMSINDRDRFILSKGHACPALYSVAAEAGIIDRSKLKCLRKLNNELQGHPSRTSAPWVEASTGSLGQGFSFAIGEAYGLKFQNIQNRVYVMLGDGELQEGEVWEGVMFAGHHNLDNLCAIIDYNKMQSDDLNENIIRLEPLADKWRAFNWDVLEIDGHNFKDIETAFNEARKTNEKPTVIIAHTIKGKGVSYMEASPAWHGSAKLSRKDIERALFDLGTSADQIEEAMHE